MGGWSYCICWVLEMERKDFSFLSINGGILILCFGETVNKGIKDETIIVIVVIIMIILTILIMIMKIIKTLLMDESFKESVYV